MVDTGSSLVTGPSLSMNKIWKAVGHHVTKISFCFNKKTI